MRWPVIFLIMLFSVVSCKDAAKIIPLENSDKELIGQWQLVAQSYSIGTPERAWSAVEDGYVLSLENDNQFLSDQVEGCHGGEFEIKGDSLILDLQCEIPENIYVYTFNVDGKFLYLGPLSPYMCFEGCSYKLKKIE